MKKSTKIVKTRVENREILLDTLYKKGIGYTTEEVVEEYAGGEGGGELLKRKVTTKHVPPDLTALKSYIEYTKAENQLDSMTTEELEKEKIRLLNMLKLEEERNEARKSNNKM